MAMTDVIGIVRQRESTFGESARELAILCLGL